MNDQFTKDDIEFDRQFLTMAAFKEVTGLVEVPNRELIERPLQSEGEVVGVANLLNQWHEGYISKEELRRRVRNLATRSYCIRRGMTYLFRYYDDDDEG